MNRAETLAPAKVNLGLAVTGRRDDGFHNLHSIMATLDVGDIVGVEALDAAGIRLELSGNTGGVPSGPDNLAWRAAAAFTDWLRSRHSHQEAPGLLITLHKTLPVAAGLGGGSSDAAAVLRCLAALFDEAAPINALALGLGSDVPFLLHGGVRLVSGRGEVLEPLSAPPLYLVLANPGVAVSAREAYAGLAGRCGSPLEVEAIQAALQAGDEPPWRNDLQPWVATGAPAVREALDALRSAGLRGVLMSGSGSTCFGLAGSDAQARREAFLLAGRRPTWWVTAARTAALPKVATG